MGPREDSLAYLEGSYSYVTDTPDFFRRAYQHYPEHGGRFTGQPAYFKHVTNAVRALLDELGYEPDDFAAVVFHQPNAKFPQQVARTLGFSPEQVRTGLLAPPIGNAYAASSLLGLTAILDQSNPGDRILLASFGSGAGSDAFSFVTTDLIKERRGLAPRTSAYVARRKAIDYGLYVRYRRKLVVH